MQIQSIPLFVQVAETIKTRIANHEYGPGDCIPSARELEKAFNVSNITIRRAVEQLAREGYIVPRRGTRPQVAEPENSRVEIEITGDFRTWVDSATGKKLGITAKLMERKTMACPVPIRQMLRLTPKTDGTAHHTRSQPQQDSHLLLYHLWCQQPVFQAAQPRDRRGTFCRYFSKGLPDQIEIHGTNRTGIHRRSGSGTDT